MRFCQVKEPIHRGRNTGFGVGDPFILTTDWSKENIARVLAQVQDGKERFLGCWGRKCNKYKKKYPSYKGELLAVNECIKKWKHILSYRPFEVHIDALALKYLTTMKNQSGLFMRWYQELAGFNFTVIHKKGKENSKPDDLSRSSHMAEALPLEKDEYAKCHEIDKPVIKFEGGVNEIQQIQPSLIEIAKEQSKDEVWSKVSSWIEKGQLPENS